MAGICIHQYLHPPGDAAGRPQTDYRTILLRVEMVSEVLERLGVPTCCVGRLITLLQQQCSHIASRVLRGLQRFNSSHRLILSPSPPPPDLAATQARPPRLRKRPPPRGPRLLKVDSQLVVHCRLDPGNTLSMPASLQGQPQPVPENRAAASPCLQPPLHQLEGLPDRLIFAL
jgi:hypothetical protein